MRYRDRSISSRSPRNESGVGPYAEVSAFGFSSGVVNGDAVQCTGTAATFDTPDAGVAKTVTVSGLTLTGDGSANYALVSQTALTTASITTTTVTATVTVAPKTYDGTTVATVSSCAVNGAVGEDPVGCVGTATFDTPSAGATKSVTVTGLILTGAVAGNYSLASTIATTTATIAPVTVTPTVTAANKAYDGTTSATLTSCTVSGTIGTDAVGCAGSAAFASASVGTGKTVVAAALTLTGAAAGNYVLTSTTATTTASITVSTVTATITAANKTYNGTTGATLTGCTVSGTAAGDVVGCSGIATFDTAAIGTAKTVTATGLTLTGSAAGDYSLSSTTATTTAAISTATVSATVVVASKAYDGTTNATLASCSVSGLFGGDVLTCTGTAVFDSANVGMGKTVTVTGLALSGPAASNYVLSGTTVTVSAAITRSRRPRS